MIELIVNGKPFTEFIDAECTVSKTSMANSFSFVASAVELFPAFKLKDKVEVWVEGVKKLTGSIENVSGSDEEGNHTVTYSGRDKTGDFIDSDVVGFDDSRGELSLKRVIELILSNIGLDLKVIDELKPSNFNTAEDVIDAKDGTNALQIAIEYAQKRQAILSSNADGNICIEDMTATDSGATLQRKKNGINNMISQSWDINTTDVYNKYVHKGQLAPRSLNSAGNTGLNLVQNQGGTVIDDDIRIGRQRVIIEDKSYSSKQLKDKALWNSQLSKAKATTFSCVVKGHSIVGGDIWEPNTLVLISSDAADINRKMLLDEITFSESEGLATITDLVFVEKGVYSIVPEKSKPVGELNDAFV